MSIGWLPTLMAVCSPQTHGVTLQARDANEAVVRAVAGDLRRLRDALEPHSADDPFACRVDQEQRRLLVINGDDSAAIGRSGNAGKRARGLNLAEQFSVRQINHRDRAVFFILSVEPPAAVDSPKPPYSTRSSPIRPSNTRIVVAILMLSLEAMHVGEMTPSCLIRLTTARGSCASTNGMSSIFFSPSPRLALYHARESCSVPIITPAR
jgi:hypothetical protein